jgi:hypothetical protein
LFVNVCVAIPQVAQSVSLQISRGLPQSERTSDICYTIRGSIKGTLAARNK